MRRYAARGTAPIREGWRQVSGWFASPPRPLLILWVGVPMLGTWVISVAISRQLDPWWQQVLIGLAGACMGVVFTVFYVEWIVERMQVQRALSKTELGRYRLQTEAVLFVSSCALLWGQQFDPMRD